MEFCSLVGFEGVVGESRSLKQRKEFETAQRV